MTCKNPYSNLYTKLACCNFGGGNGNKEGSVKGCRGQQLSTLHTRRTCKWHCVFQTVVTTILGVTKQPKKNRYTEFSSWTLYGIAWGFSTTNFAPWKWDSLFLTQKNLNDQTLTHRLPTTHHYHCATTSPNANPQRHRGRWPRPSTCLFQPFLNFISAVHSSYLQASFFVTCLAGLGWNVIFH